MKPPRRLVLGQTVSGWFLLLAPIFLLLASAVAVRSAHVESELRRQAALDQFSFRLVLPPEIDRSRVEQWAGEIRAWLSQSGGPLQDGQGSVSVLMPEDVARQLPLQESWISEGLSNLPLPPVLPSILEVRSRRALGDAVMARDLIQALRELHPQGLVVHEQLALDATLSAHRIERGVEGRTAMVANGTLALGLLWLLMAWWFLRRKQPTCEDRT